MTNLMQEVYGFSYKEDLKTRDIFFNFNSDLHVRLKANKKANHNQQHNRVFCPLSSILALQSQPQQPRTSLPTQNTVKHKHLSPQDLLKQRLLPKYGKNKQSYSLPQQITLLTLLSLRWVCTDKFGLYFLNKNLNSSIDKQIIRKLIFEYIPFLIAPL